MPTGWAVMVWIHGGGLTAGASKRLRPHLHWWEGGNVIVVTVNIASGMLGFFAQSALDAERPSLLPITAFLDQQFALGWVQKKYRVFWR